jgi:hypothetical protein
MNIHQKLKQSRLYHQFMCYNNKSTFNTLKTGESKNMFYFLNARRIRNDFHFCCTVPVLRPYDLASLTLEIRRVCDTNREILTRETGITWSNICPRATTATTNTTKMHLVSKSEPTLSNNF